MIKIIFRKVKGGERIRDDVIEGLCFHLPQLGLSFRMTSESELDPEAARVITTSKVTRIDYQIDGEIIFTTLNSTYSLTVVDEDLET